MSAINIGASALRAATTRLQTTSHNIANASTPGYTRQETHVASLNTQFGPDGFTGGGVAVQTVVRRYDQHLTREVNTATAMRSADQSRSASLGRLEQLFSDTSNGLGPQYDSFNSSVADMVNQPADQASRMVALERASSLAASIRNTDGEIDRMRVDSDAQAAGLVSSLNDGLTDLARLNERIAAASGSHAPNDLLDQRDSLIEQVNNTLQANAHINDDDTVTLFAATGDALLVGNKPATLSLQSEANNPQQLALALNTANQPVVLNQRMLGGGELAGTLRFRNEDLVNAQTRLGQIAGSLGSAYNNQQERGVDGDGNSGSALFGIGQARALASSNNNGDAQIAINISDGSKLQATDYQLERTGGQYVLTRNQDNFQQTLTELPATVDGLEITLQSGAMAEGDTIALETGSAFAGNFSMKLQTASQWSTGYAAIPVMGEQNSGSLTVSNFDVVQQDANVAQPVSLAFGDNGMVTVSGVGTGNPAPFSWQSGESISFNGWEMTLAGEPQAGDTITVTAPTNPQTDNRNARAMLALSEQPTVNGRPTTQAVGALIGEVGAASQSAINSAEQSDAWHANAVVARDEVSGVNLDEEAVRLLQFQQAYQAAARIISTSQSMFESLLNATR